MRTNRGVERSLLVRIFAIAQFHRRLAIDRQHIGEHLSLIGKGEPLADHRIIGCGGGKGLGSHAAAEIERGRPVLRIHFCGQRCVIGGIGHDGDEMVVLGSRTHHAGSANIDILDNLRALCPARNSRFKRIEIDHHQINRADCVLFHRGEMFGIVAHGQQAAMDHGVQRLHPAIHHLGKAGQVGHVLDLKPRLAQRPGSATGRNQFDPARRQCLAQFYQAGLVGH